MKARKAFKSLVVVLFLSLLCLVFTEALVFISERMLRSPLHALENQIVDLAFQVRAKNEQHQQVKTEDIVIIDVDDASIEKLGRNQLWPRLFDARAIEYISSGNPKAFGIDFLYPESDSLPYVYQELLEEKGYTDAKLIVNSLSTDSAFTKALMAAGNVYLSCFDDDSKIFDIADTSLFSLITTIHPYSGSYLKACDTLNYPTLPYIDFTKAAKAVGTILMPTMKDGTVRNYSLLHTLPGYDKNNPYIANFPLYMFLDAKGIPISEVSLSSEGLIHKDTLLIPLDSKGTFRINWLGTAKVEKTRMDSIRYIPYYKILDERIPSEFFEDKYVFFGTSATGLEDLKTVPTQHTYEKMPGVEVHAIAFLNMMNGAFIHEISQEEARPYFLLASLLLVSLFLVLRPLLGIVVSLSFLIAELLAFVYWVLPQKAMVFPIVSLMLLTFLCYLTASLYIYFIRERKSRIMKNAFGSYVSREVVEQISKNSNILKLGGERKELTVMFSDIRGFTNYSEKMAPEEIVSVLNDYLSRMSEVIFAYKGTIDKFIGDAIMAIFGAPILQKDHADKACTVALEMMNEIKRLNKECSADGQAPMNVGIGINTGEMTVGNIGSRKRFDYTVIGDEVNLGSRLEGLTKFFGVDIIVSGRTKDACISENFLFRNLGSVKVKGKEKAVEVFQLLEYSQSGQHLHSWLKQWNEAMTFWNDNNRKQAKDSFLQCLQYHLEDSATHYYISRCDEPVENPSDISPVIIMDSK